MKRTKIIVKVIIKKDSISEKVKSFVALIVQELEMLKNLLKRHPKSYTLWSYREWVVVQSVAIDKKLSLKGIQDNLRVQAVDKEF